MGANIRCGVKCVWHQQKPVVLCLFGIEQNKPNWQAEEGMEIRNTPGSIHSSLFLFIEFFSNNYFLSVPSLLHKQAPAHGGQGEDEEGCEAIAGRSLVGLISKGTYRLVLGTTRQDLCTCRYLQCLQRRLNMAQTQLPSRWSWPHMAPQGCGNGGQSAHSKDGGHAVLMWTLDFMGWRKPLGSLQRTMGSN